MRATLSFLKTPPDSKDQPGNPTSLVVEPNVSPVVIETEVLPATTVESEAQSRLGAQHAHDGAKNPVINCSSPSVKAKEQIRKRLEQGFDRSNRS